MLAEAVVEVFFFIGVGVVLAFVDADEDFGLGVPLIGFEARFAGVGVCLAISYIIVFYISGVCVIFIICPVLLSGELILKTIQLNMVA